MRVTRQFPVAVLVVLVITAAASAPQVSGASRVVEVNGIEMRYDDIGEGEVLLLLHAGTESARMWDSLAPRLGQGRRLIIPDLRGHGGSTNPGGVWSTRQLAADVFALLDALEVERVKAVGASIGGMTLLRMAALQPERIEAMVVVGVGAEIPEACGAILASVDADALDEPAWQRLRAVHTRGDDQIRALYAWVASLAERGEDTRFSREQLAGVGARTLVVNGDRDYCFPAASACQVAEGIPEASLWVVPGGSHVPISGDNAERFVATATEFLGLDATAAAPRQDEVEEVRRAIEYAIGWAVDKDFDRMFASWAQDDRLFHHWLTSSSTLTGFDAFKAHAEQWRDPKFKGTTSDFRDLEITFSRSGDVAWYSCRLDDCYEYDGVPGCVRNVLQTGVLEKRDGRWVHVLMHGSYPVDELPPELVRKYYGELRPAPAFEVASGSEPPGVVERAALARMGFLEGDWAGEGWAVQSSGERTRFWVEESFHYRGVTDLMDMQGIFGAILDDGTRAPSAEYNLGILFFDRGSGEYRMWHYSSSGEVFTTPMVVDHDARSMHYTKELADGRVGRFHLVVAADGVWTSRFDLLQEDGSWLQVMGFRMTRVGA